MAQAELDVYTEVVDGITVLSLVGPVDSATFDDLKAALHPLNRGEASRCLVDCTRLTYINSKGIGLLANLHRQSMIQMGYVAFCGLTPRIMKTMELLGLGKRLHIFENRETALASFPDLHSSSSGES